MMNKEKLVKEYLTTITHRLSADYGLSLDDAVKEVENLDLLNTYKDDYYFLLHEDISTWVNIAYDNYRLKFNRPLFLTPTLKQAIKDIEKHTEIDNNHLKEEKKVLKENTMDNYIVINGKKTELTEEQLKQLGIEVKKKKNNPFNSEPEKVNDIFYYITSDGVRLNDDNDYNADMITTANSFNDEEFANQIYLRELLYRKLLKYAYDNGAEDCEWNSNNNNCHYYIYFNYQFNEFIVTSATRCKNYFCTYFSSEKVARQAINNVVKPFIKEHPEFVW